MPRLLYQAKFEPIVVATAPTPTVDGWGQPPSVPVRRKGMSAAVRAASGAAPIDPWALTQPETVSVDRFRPNYPDRVPGRRLAVANQQSLAWTPIPIAPPLSPDFGFMVQAAPIIPRRRGASQYQQPFSSNWPVPVVVPTLALHAFVTWVD